MSRLLGTCLVLLGLAASTGRAQTVRGRALHADSTPVPGVVVLLLDAAGQIAARSLTNERGEYRLTAPSPGDFRLRTVRIGFRPATLPPFALRAGQELERTIALHETALAFDTIRVAERARCAPYDSVSMVAEVWQQARTAFTAAQLTAADPLLRAGLARYESAIDERTRVERTLTTSRESGFAKRTWRALSADSLHRAGYVQRLPDGGALWFAPDLDVLMSDRFLADHCFRLVQEAGALGIRFEPARDRSRIAEIEGIVWLDAGTSDLRRMSFRYVNTPLAERGEAGGDMHFVRLANGGWAIERWSIRMPVFAERVRPSAGVPGDVGRMELVVAETRVASGELTHVTRGADTVWLSPTLLLARGTLPALVEPPSVTPAAPGPATGSARAEPDTSRVVALAPVVAASTRITSEFDERRLRRMGQFITRDDLEKHPSRKLADFMRTVPGARLAQADGQSFVTSGRGVTGTFREPRMTGSQANRESRAACYVDVWLNGVQVYGRRSDEMLFDINTISPDMIEGVEFYASAALTPAQYQRYGAGCGTLLIWLRKQ